MPAHPTTVAEYCDVLARSKLVPEADVRVLPRRWRAEANGDDADVDGFRRFLVSQKLLTEYQAALVGRGRADGFVLGGYTILDRLGRGAMAGVYKAAHPSGQVVALKVLPASRAKDPNVLARFQREGRMLCQLDHPNVVRAFHVGQAGQNHFIVMEHLDGETLDEVLARRKRLPVPEAARVAAQALRGLQHLHEKRMVHRDLKPANLMVVRPDAPAAGRSDTTLDGTVKLLDIGIGRELFDEASPDTQEMMLTAVGTILGTPDYLAPEQARDARAADVRSDVYSLGCVLFHLIAGRPPFTDKTVMALTVKHATEKLPNLAELVPGAPPALQAVLDRMTAKKPEDRYQTPAEAADALRPFLPANTRSAAASPVVPGYQRWLETESGMDMPAPPELTQPSAARPGQVVSMPVPGAARPAAPAAPVAKPSRPVPAPKPAPPAVERPAAPASKPLPMPAPAPVADDMIDVELVPPGAAGDERSVFEWERRDFILLGMGAGGMFAAVAAGFGLARLLRSSPKED